MWYCCVMLIFNLHGSDRQSSNRKVSAFTAYKPTAVVAAFRVEQDEAQKCHEAWKASTDMNIQELLSKSVEQGELNRYLLAEFVEMKQSLLDLQEQDEEKDQKIELLRQEQIRLNRVMIKQRRMNRFMKKMISVRLRYLTVLCQSRQNKQTEKK